MKIEINTTDELYHNASCHVVDVVEQLKHMLEHWAARAQQENPGVDLSEVKTALERKIEADEKRKKEEKVFAEELKLRQSKELEEKKKAEELEKEQFLLQRKKEVLELLKDPEILAAAVAAQENTNSEQSKDS